MQPNQYRSALSGDMELGRMEGLPPIGAAARRRVIESAFVAALLPFCATANDDRVGSDGRAACPSGQQSFGDQCVSDEMFGYLKCVEERGVARRTLLQVLPDLTARPEQTPPTLRQPDVTAMAHCRTRAPQTPVQPKDGPPPAVSLPPAR